MQRKAKAQITDRKYLLITIAISVIFNLRYILFNPILWDDLPYQISWKNKYYPQLFQIALDAGLPIYHTINYFMYVLLQNELFFGIFNVTSIFLSVHLFIKYLELILGKQSNSDKLALFIICNTVNIYSVYFIKNAALYHFSIPVILATILLLNSPGKNKFHYIILFGFNLLAFTIASSLFYAVSLMLILGLKKYHNRGLDRITLNKFLIYLAFSIIFFIAHKVFFPTAGNYVNYNRIEFKLYTLKGILNTYELSIKGIVNFFRFFMIGWLEGYTLMLNILLSLGVITIILPFINEKKNQENKNYNEHLKLFVLGIILLCIAIFPYALVRKSITMSHELRYSAMYYMGLSLFYFSIYKLVLNKYIKLFMITVIVFIGNTCLNNNIIRWLNQEHILNTVAQSIINQKIDKHNFFQIDIRNSIDIPRQLTYYELNGNLFINNSRWYNTSYGNFIQIKTRSEYLKLLEDDIFKKNIGYRNVLLTDRIPSKYNSIKQICLNIPEYASPLNFYLNPLTINNIVITDFNENINCRNKRF